jgi:hypothetical protein
VKLYVWEGVLCDYTCGLACVLAHDLEEAGALVVAKYPEWANQLPLAKVRVVNAPEAFAVHGGG